MSIHALDATIFEKMWNSFSRSGYSRFTLRTHPLINERETIKAENEREKYLGAKSQED